MYTRDEVFEGVTNGLRLPQADVVRTKEASRVNVGQLFILRYVLVVDACLVFLEVLVKELVNGRLTLIILLNHWSIIFILLIIFTYIFVILRIQSFWTPKLVVFLNSVGTEHICVRHLLVLVVCRCCCDLEAVVRRYARQIRYQLRTPLHVIVVYEKTGRHVWLVWYFSLLIKVVLPALRSLHRFVVRGVRHDDAPRDVANIERLKSRLGAHMRALVP